MNPENDTQERGENAKNIFSQLKFDLTNRELDILQCAANGLSISKTAEKLFISIDTVESHRTSVIKKMKAANITEAVSIGHRKRIIK